jgi:hypothetical protein
MSGESDQQFLIRYLWHHRLPCPHCGRELHELQSAVCPECHGELRIGVGMTQPPLRGWLVLAIPLIASAGIGVMMVILMMTAGMPSQSRYPYIGAAMAYFGLAIPLAAITLIARRKIMRWERYLQATAATVVWILSATALILMFARGH